MSHGNKLICIGNAKFEKAKTYKVAKNIYQELYVLRNANFFSIFEINLFPF